MNRQQRGDVVKCASLIFNVVTKSGVAKSLQKKYLPLEEIGDKDRRAEKECRSVKRGDWVLICESGRENRELDLRNSTE